MVAPAGEKHGKALVIYGAAHFYRILDKDYLSSMGDDIGIVRMLGPEVYADAKNARWSLDSNR